MQQPQRRQMDDSWLGRNGRLAFLIHWWGLVLREFPMTHHRQWLGLTQRRKSSPGTTSGEEGVIGSNRKKSSLKRRLLLGMGSTHRRWAEGLGFRVEGWNPALWSAYGSEDS